MKTFSYLQKPLKMFFYESTEGYWNFLLFKIIVKHSKKGQIFSIKNKKKLQKFGAQILQIASY